MSAPLVSHVESRDMPAPMVGTPEHATVLVVEDEHLVALDIRVRLERMGHHPVVVYAGEDALRAAAEVKPDLVLMDIKLKGTLDGIDTARSLRASFDVPVIYLTAYADNHTLERARVTEPYGYVLKPFQDRELKAAIDMALQRHASDRQRTEQQQIERFLADASAQLAATLDFRGVARNATELIVPRYADWCEIKLVEAGDLVPAHTVTRPEADEVSLELGGNLPERVRRTGHSEILTHVTETKLLGDHEVHSVLCVPLITRRQVLGTLTLVAAGPRSPYSITDLLFAEDFARRLGIALDNALLYRAAERAIRMRDDVLAIVSHDLRTPLGTIVMQAEVLGATPAFEACSKSITRAAQRMHRMIGDLLDASAINAGSLTLDLGVHSAADIAREAIDMFRSQAEARASTLNEVLLADSITVRCDRDRIVQVLSNLIGNSLKFTPRGGTITVRVVREGPGVAFEVQDTGEGIAPDALPHLFDRFWRGERRTTGVGLGLYICRGIVTAHGSTLRVESTLGVGSRFYFSLPEVRT